MQITEWPDLKYSSWIWANYLSWNYLRRIVKFTRALLNQTKVSDDIPFRLGKFSSLKLFSASSLKVLSFKPFVCVWEFMFMRLWDYACMSVCVCVCLFLVYVHGCAWVFVRACVCICVRLREPWPYPNWLLYFCIFHRRNFLSDADAYANTHAGDLTVTWDFGLSVHNNLTYRIPEGVAR